MLYVSSYATSEPTSAQTCASRGAVKFGCARSHSMAPKAKLHWGPRDPEKRTSYIIILLVYIRRRSAVYVHSFMMSDDEKNIGLSRFHCFYTI